MFGRKSQMPDTPAHPSPASTTPGTATQEWSASQPHAADAAPAQPLNAAPASRSATPPTSVIGDNFAMEGDNITIRCQGSLQVNGSIDAELHCEELTIGDAGRINGAISADDVRVHGRVAGTINGSHVTLYATAEVEGDINSRYLAIERGARFDGRSRRVDNAEEVAPQLQGASSYVSEATPTAMDNPAPAHASSSHAFAQPASSDDTAVPNAPWNAA